jgi:nicotinate dehydrogenase subunit A
MITLSVNGASRTLDVDPETPLLYVLRDDLALHGPRFGCGLSQCGACTVIMDGVAIRSCVTPVAKAAGHKVTTLEGLGSVQKPHPVQKAFIEEQAAQCGYCINGMIMTAKAFLDKKPNPSDREIRQALAGNLCRCGTHQRIVRAVKRAAAEMAKGG